jgi:hypothetical protein
MQWNQNLDDEVLVDGSVPLSGVDTTHPPNSIANNLSASSTNRLCAMDNLNRPRPGVIARMEAAGGNFDSISHLGSGRFLYNNGPNWGIYDSRSQVNTDISGGPVFANGDEIYSALCDTVLYFTRGGSLWKYDPSVPGFGTNPIPSQWPTALYPIWAFSQLIYANKNTLVVSDILNPESWHPATQEITLDPIATDEITGVIVWQFQTLVVFRNGSTWVVQTGPNLDVPDWELNKASSTIGCCTHGTIVQCGVDVFFLSETGRGVYALSQMPTSNQLGVWTPISAPIKYDIDRINWAAIGCARATYWNDLYLLSVPLDGATYNNYILAFSVTLGTWQGNWCIDIAGADHGFRDSARDRTNPDETVLLIGTTDGAVSEFTYPPDRRYYDTDINGVQTPIESTLVTRSFTFQTDVQTQYTGTGGMNKIQPHSVRFQFLESEVDVTVTAITDRANQPFIFDTPTSGSLLTLPIAQLPFDLDVIGYYWAPISLMSIGVCGELQLQLDGDGDWDLFQIKASAWEAAPMELL